MAQTKSDETQNLNHFEQNINKLEKIVKQLEDGELTLSQSIDKFEEAIKLFNACKDGLSVAEKKIKILTDELKVVDYQA